VFDPVEWVARSRHVVGADGLVLLHLHAGDAAPSGFVERARREWQGWAAVAGTLA
jgi:hypothetical protein